MTVHAPINRREMAAAGLAGWAATTPGEHVVPLLIAALRRHVSCPDLAAALACIGAIYEADPMAGRLAAEDIEQAARDICIDRGIDA